MGRRTRYAIVFVSAWLVGLAWALSSPTGSSPDDGFHLTSIWCATDDPESCVEQDVTSPDIAAQVPLQLLAQGCYAFKPAESGACADVPDDEIATSTWFNTDNYPPTYYQAMSVFVGPDIARSIVLMRIATLTCALLVLGLAAWSAPVLRDSQLLAWATVSIPLWMFLLASTNPSAWAIAGVAAMWPAAYALMHAEPGRGLILPAAAVVAAAVLSTSRGDSAAMAVAVFTVVAIVYFDGRRHLAGLAVAILPMLILVATFFMSSQTESLQEGLTGYGDLGGLDLLWANLLELPDIWLGAFGATFGLGWIDTIMPSLVWFPPLAVVSALVVLGLARISLRRGLLLLALGGLLVLLPLVILQRSGAPVGSGVQPRYMLPLLAAWVGIAVAPIDGIRLRLSPPQRWILTGLVVVATSIALHVQLRRYTTGTDVVGFNLNNGQEWAYVDTIGPMGLWAIGSLASVALFVAVFGFFVGRPEPDMAESEPSTDGEPDSASLQEEPLHLEQN